MKFPVLTALIAGASVASYAAASPLRVVVVTNAEVPSNIRFGKAVNPDVAQIVKPVFKANMASGAEIQEAGPLRGGRGPCHGGKIRAEVMHLSNKFRQALGLPIIEAYAKAEVEHDLVHIMPHPFIGAPVRLEGEIPVRYHDHPDHPNHPDHPHKHHRHHKHHKHHKHIKHIKKHIKAFLKRIHTALLALGPWEGRAVAFVLGCGIGVLLRMFWVISVIAFRMIRGRREEPQYIEVVYEHYTDAENILVPPPHYVCEKGDNEVTDAKKQIDEA